MFFTFYGLPLLLKDLNLQLTAAGNPAMKMPMMGMHVKNPDIPIIKTTNCVLIKKKEPSLQLKCSDYTPRGIERLKKNFIEADEIFQFDMINGDWTIIDPQNICLFYRVAEVFDDDNEIVVKLEAPGMEADDFDIQIRSDVLIVRGEKKFQREQNKGNYHLMECAYGRFERAIPLPGEVDEARTSASYKHGLLHITLAKAEQQRGHRIKVDVA